MAHFPATDPGPSGPGDLELPSIRAELFILLIPDQPGAITAGPSEDATRAGHRCQAWQLAKCDTGASIPADRSPRCGRPAAGGCLAKNLAARCELREL
jgi:hypothetical protein